MLLPALRSDMSHAPLPRDVAAAATRAATALRAGGRGTDGGRRGAPVVVVGGGCKHAMAHAMAYAWEAPGRRPELGADSAAGAPAVESGDGGSVSGAAGGVDGCSGVGCGADKGAAGFAARPYLTCCVRLSPEKEPHRFVELVAELQRRGALERLGA